LGRGGDGCGVDGASGAGGASGPQGEVVLDADLVDVNESAKGVLMALFFLFPERKDYIKKRVRDLLNRGTDPMDIEAIIMAEIRADEAEVLAAREGRIEKIQAHGTQGGVVPLTRHEARLAAAVDRRNQAEGANVGWLQKKSRVCGVG
jgi:hypothetical protein